MTSPVKKQARVQSAPVRPSQDVGLIGELTQLPDRTLVNMSLHLLFVDSSVRMVRGKQVAHVSWWL